LSSAIFHGKIHAQPVAIVHHCGTVWSIVFVKSNPAAFTFPFLTLTFVIANELIWMKDRGHHWKICISLEKMYLIHLFTSDANPELHLQKNMSCQHPRTEFIEIHETYVRFIFWEHEIVSERCLDCAEILRSDRLKGRLSDLTYSETTIDQRNCPHKHFEVDTKTITNERESTISGSILRFFSGAGWDGVQYRHFWGAEATCNRCGFLFYARADSDEIMRDQKSVRVISSPWTPVLDVEKKGDATIKKFVPVPKKQ
jgi:hypothetical protein